MDSFGKVVFLLPPAERKLGRRIENLCKKITNAKYAVLFNKKCIQENLFPKFSNVRLHDRTVQQKRFTLDFRRKLLHEQILQKQNQLKELTADVDRAMENFRSCNIPTELRDKFERALQHSLSMHTNATETRITKKLCHLYGGKMLLPEKLDGFVNLSDFPLSKDQEEFLNLGLNSTTHLLSRSLKRLQNWRCYIGIYVTFISLEKLY